MSVDAVSASDDARSFSKQEVPAIQLCSGTDTVFLIDGAIYTDIQQPLTIGGLAYCCSPGDFGEHITTSALDITSFPVGTMLRFNPKPSLVPENNGTSNLEDAIVILTRHVWADASFENFAAGLEDRINDRGRPVGMVGSVVQDGFVMAGQIILFEEPEFP